MRCWLTATPRNTSNDVDARGYGRREATRLLKPPMAVRAPAYPQRESRRSQDGLPYVELSRRDTASCPEPPFRAGPSRNVGRARDTLPGHRRDVARPSARPHAGTATATLRLDLRSCA